MLALSIYACGIRIGYYADDFQFVFPSPTSAMFWYFSHNNANNGFYRPLQALFMATVQACFGMETWPVHLVQILLHVILAWAIRAFMVDLGFSELASGVGSIYMLIAQANAQTVLENDTLSQLGGTLCGFMSVWAAYRFSRDRNTFSRERVPPARRSAYGLSIAALSFALFFKESSVAFVPLTGLLLLRGTFSDGLSASAIERHRSTVVIKSCTGGKTPGAGYIECTGRGGSRKCSAADRHIGSRYYS